MTGAFFPAGDQTGWIRLRTFAFNCWLIRESSAAPMPKRRKRSV